MKDTLLNFETFTASLAGNGERIDSVVRRVETGVVAADVGIMKVDKAMNGIGSVKFGELLPAVQSVHELVQSFNKKSGVWILDTRRALGDISASINKKFGGPRR